MGLHKGRTIMFCIKNSDSFKKFLELVLPEEGNKIITLVMPTENGNSWFKYKTYPTAGEAARAALNFDQRGETVYFAVNSFGDWYHDPKKDKKRIRTQENVVSCRSMYDDFDVGEDEDGKYSTRREALADIIKLAKALQLTPTITSSGGGYHAYFSFDEDVTVEVWEELSAMKRDVTTHLKLKADRAVDMDSARILRPVGTTNRKNGQERPVELVKLGKPYPVEKVREKLQAYIKDNNVSPAPTNKKQSAENPFAAALGDYPESDADVVAEHCAAVREFKESGGNIPEPHWHRAIGVVKFCENGEQVIHDWSKNYDGYSQIETQDKIDEWSVGPTSCIEMDKHVDCMKNCPMANKCKFPIQLGALEPSLKSVESNERLQISDLTLDGFTAANYLREAPQPVRYVIDQILTADIGSGLLSGQGGIGKTWLTYQLGFSVATGRPFLDRYQIPEPGLVLIFTAENGYASIQRRLHSIKAHYELLKKLTDLEHDDLNKNLIIVPTESVRIRLVKRWMGSTIATESVSEIVKLVKKSNLKPSIIIVDPISRFNGGDENNAEDMTLFVEQLEELKRLSGAETVIATHHVNKSSGRNSASDQFSARGSSALVDGVRWGAVLSSLTEKQKQRIPPEFHKLYMNFSVAKANDMPFPDPLMLMRTNAGVLVAADKHNYSDTSEQADMRKVVKVVGEVEHLEPLSKRKFADKYKAKLDMSRDSILKLLKAGEEKGYIKQNSVRGVERCLSLTSLGEKIQRGFSFDS